MIHGPYNTKLMRLVLYTSVRDLFHWPTRNPDRLSRSRTTPYRPHSHLLRVSFIRNLLMRHAMTTGKPSTAFMSLKDTAKWCHLFTFSSVLTNFKGTWRRHNATEGKLTSVLLISFCHQYWQSWPVTALNEIRTGDGVESTRLFKLSVI